MVARRFNAVSVELFLRKYGYSEEIHGGLRLKSVAPMALFHANHVLPQGGLHYRLVTLGYRKRNTDGVDACVLQSNGVYAML